MSGGKAGRAESNLEVKESNLEVKDSNLEVKGVGRVLNTKLSSTSS